MITNDEARLALAAVAEDMLAASGHHNFIAQAPVHVMICTSAEIYRARYREPDKQAAIADWTDERLWPTPFWHVDAGAALMLMLLAAVHEEIAAARTTTRSAWSCSVTRPRTRASSATSARPAGRGVRCPRWCTGNAGEVIISGPRSGRPGRADP